MTPTDSQKEMEWLEKKPELPYEADDNAEADQIDDDELNEILWRAIRNDAPPPPVRSYFGK